MKRIEPIYNLANESICMFPLFHKNNVAYFFGIGLVMQISRGNEFDLVNMSFTAMGNKIRPVIVAGNNARRQLLTLKRGQYALVYGVAKKEWNKSADPNFKPVYYAKWRLYAYMIQGMYVPKMFDYKKNEEDIANGIEENQFDEMTDAQVQAYQESAKEAIGSLLFGDEDEGDYNG